MLSDCDTECIVVQGSKCGLTVTMNVSLCKAVNVE